MTGTDDRLSKALGADSADIKDIVAKKAAEVSPRATGATWDKEVWLDYAGNVASTTFTLDDPASTVVTVVSRGGSLLFAWMQMTGNENPFFEYYDDVLDILRRYDVTISLGDALRPGCIDDASDAGQISELI